MMDYFAVEGGRPLEGRVFVHGAKNSALPLLAATLLAGRTVVLITHDPQEACRLSHRLLVLSAADGDIDDSHHLAGTPPRAPDAPDLLIGQAALLQQLMRAQP